MCYTIVYCVTYSAISMATLYYLFLNIQATTVHLHYNNSKQTYHTTQAHALYY